MDHHEWRMRVFIDNEDMKKIDQQLGEMDRVFEPYGIHIEMGAYHEQKLKKFRTMCMLISADPIVFNRNAGRKQKAVNLSEEEISQYEAAGIILKNKTTKKKTGKRPSIPCCIRD